MIDDLYETTDSRFRVTDHGIITPPNDTLDGSQVSIKKLALNEV